MPTRSPGNVAHEVAATCWTLWKWPLDLAIRESKGLFNLPGGRRAVSGADTPPTLPARRRVGQAVRGNWRRIAGAVIIALGTPIGIIAGWASPNDRGWWLLAAGGCAGLGTLLGLSSRGQPAGAAEAATAPDRASTEGAQPGRVWNIPAPVRSFTGRDTQLLAPRQRGRAAGRAGSRRRAVRHGRDRQDPTGPRLRPPVSQRLPAGLVDPGRNPPDEPPLNWPRSRSAWAPHVDLPPLQQLAYAQQALATQDRWLLIFDNATNPTQLEPLLPATGSGEVLITSRNSAWHGLADPIAVDLLPRAAAAELSSERSGDSDQQTAAVLAEELGRLPLALEQAAAYASRQQMSLGQLP